MELIGKVTSKDNTKIVMLPSALRHVSINFADQCLHILNNKEILNGIKGNKKMEKIESLFKYQSRIYNVQRNSDVNHRCMKMRWNKIFFPSLNVINGKTYTYVRKGIIRHYHYRSDPKLGPGIVSIIRIPCSFHD